MRKVLLKLLRMIVKRYLRDYHISHNPRRLKQPKNIDERIF